MASYSGAAIGDNHQLRPNHCQKAQMTSKRGGEKGNGSGAKTKGPGSVQALGEKLGRKRLSEKIAG